MSLLRYILFLVAIVFSISFASQWNAASVPTRNAVVTLRSGKTLTGDVYRTLSGDFEIDANGERTRVPTTDAVIVSFAPPQQGRGGFLLENWRFFVPPLVVFAIAFWFIGRSLPQLVRDTQNAFGGQGKRDIAR